MYIRKLTIDNYGDIGHMDLKLFTRINHIECPVPEALAGAVKKLLMYDDKDKSVIKTGQDTKLYTEVVAGGKTIRISSNGEQGDISAYTVGKDKTVTDYDTEYQHLLKRCTEEDRTSVFPGPENSEVNLRAYLRKDDSYETHKFNRDTDGMGSTHTFRQCLKDYMNNCPKQGKDGKSGISDFLDVAGFWDYFGRLRDMHYEGKPLLICDPSPEMQKEVEDNKGKICRQVLLISQPGICTRKKGMIKHVQRYLLAEEGRTHYGESPLRYCGERA